MKLLGSLKGSGYVTLSGRREGPFEYSLNVTESGNARSGSGNLTGDMMVLYRTFESSGSAVLELADGKKVDIVITTVDGAGAEFMANGRVPGF